MAQEIQSLIRPTSLPVIIEDQKQKNLEVIILSILKKSKFPREYSTMLAKEYLEVWQIMFDECSLNQVEAIVQKAGEYYARENASKERLMALIINEIYPQR